MPEVREECLTNLRSGTNSGNYTRNASIQENFDGQQCLALRILHLATVGMIAGSWSGRRTCVGVLHRLHGQTCGVHDQANGFDRYCAQSRETGWVAACEYLATVQVVFEAVGS